MANIQKRTGRNGAVKYRVQIRLKGHPPEAATFERITDAKKWAQQTEAAIREGRYFKTSEARKHTLGDAIDRYVEEVLPRKPKSAKKQKSQLDWWKSRIGNVTLAHVNPALITQHRQVKLKESSAGNTNRYMAVLSHLFTIALKEWQWVEDTPFRKIQRLNEPRGRVRFLSEEERTALLTACEKNTNPNLYDAVVVALSTGCRKNEIMHLRWKDIDLERGQITLHDTKNKETRAVPLAGHALERIKERSRIRRIDCDWVFPCYELPKPGDIDRDFVRARAEAQIEDFRFHDLRHSAASYLAMNGATLAEIAAVLGHKTLAMVGRYAHLSDAHTSSIVARMNAAVFGGNAEGEQQKG